MNDPGLAEPIENDANDVENQKGEGESGQQDEQAFLEPSRWWFASTAIPLIAGTFGPMGSAFSICALVVPWRVYIPPGGAAEQNGDFIPDPKWLIGINAAQLIIALVSNLFLLLNMAKRVRFSIAQPITIVGWYISSIVLIGLCACTSGPLILYPKERYAFSGAFYYAIFSASLYFLVATSMLITVWGAYKGHYAKEFQLTTSQRTLMLQTISFLVYLLSGAAVYSKVEGWKFLDAVYWADYTLLTVGIGDFSPSTHLGRSLLFPFAIGGIIILGLVIGSIRSLVLERGKVKMGARMVEKERRRLLKRIQRKEKQAILQPVDGERAAVPRGSTKKFDDEPTNMTELERRKQEFDLMRMIQEEAATKRRWTSLFVSGGTWMMLWFAGAAIFQASEHNQTWSYFGSLYFSYTSLLTIGYGDFYPQSNSGKAFFVFWSLLAVPSLTILISNMGDTILKGVRDLTLWVGKFTVLPGENGLRLAVRESLGNVKRRLRSEGRDSEKPPELLGRSKKGPVSNSATGSNVSLKREGEDTTVPTQRYQPASHSHAEMRGPKSHNQYHLTLIREIASVTKHLQVLPEKKYTFEEWAWFLKLIGEDEGSPTTHGKALETPEPGHDRVLIDDTTLRPSTDRNSQYERVHRVEWSWLGIRSPLMGEMKEAEWILERLIKKLEKNLQNTAKSSGHSAELQMEGPEGQTKLAERAKYMPTGEDG